MSKIGIIIEREFNTRVRKRSFIIATLLTPLLMVGLMVGPVIIMQLNTSNEREILVVDQSGVVGDNLQNSENIKFTLSDKSAAELREQPNEHIFGVLVIGEDVVTNPASNVDLFTYEASTFDLEQTIASQIETIIETQKLKSYNIENLPQILESIKTNITVKAFRVNDKGDDVASSSELSLVLSYIFGFMIYMFVFIYGAMVMQGVIEEKASRVLEIIVSSVKPHQLMLGKIFGIALVAITQFLIWVVLIVVLGNVAMQVFAGDIVNAGASASAMGGFPPAMAPAMAGAINTLTDVGYLAMMLGGFLIFFIGGYLLYAAMFAAIGSAVSNAEEAQQLQLPVTIPIILALLVMMSVIQEPHSTVAVWFSMIPLTSPIIMMARLPYGVPTWQLVASIVILYASFMFMVLVAAKIYRVGIFMYGKKPSFKELYKWTKYK